MADMLADALSWLNTKLTSHASTAWTYRRASQSVTINLTEEAQKLRVSDGLGNTKVERPDLAGNFSADELDFGAGVVEPQDGDTVEKSFAGTTKVFRLTPPNNGAEPCWHYCDPQQNRIRIFAKRSD